MQLIPIVELEVESWSPKVESRFHPLRIESLNHLTEVWTSLSPKLVNTPHLMGPHVKLAVLLEEVNAEWNGDPSHYDCLHMLYHLISALRKHV